MDNRGCCLSFLLLVLIHEVFLEEIQSFEGESIILPCLNSNKVLKDKATVFWRYKDIRTVYDIIDSKESRDEQDTAFRHRVEGFPDQWSKGNFSIKLSSVRKSDAGPYTCFIPTLNANSDVHLTVKDRPPTTPESRNGSVKRRPENIQLFFTFLLGCTLLFV